MHPQRTNQRSDTLTIRRRFQPPPAIRRPVGMQLGQVKQRWIHPERVLPLTHEIGVHLVPVGAREELDRGAFGVGVGIPLRRRCVSKVESGGAKRGSGQRSGMGWMVGWDGGNAYTE